MPAKVAKKAAPTVAPVDRVKQSFPKLKNASELVNKASDKLNASAANINAILKNVGLGIPSWFEFDGGQDENGGGYSWSQQIGYAKVGGKWGLAIRSTSHDWSYPEPDEETWAFADAPRSLRVKAAPHIPDLLEKLIQDASDMAQEIEKQSEEIDNLAQTILALAPEKSEGQE
jgi:hypothetical protein